MNAIDRYTDKLSDLEKQQLIADYEEFAAKGSIGECALRTHARAFDNQLGVNAVAITSWMTQLANSCYQHFARRYLENLDGGK